MHTHPAAKPPVPGSATILIVEDDAATSEFFADLLHSADYHTYVAASSTDALAQFAQHRVQLVLLDRRLPDMDVNDHLILPRA